MNEIALLGKKVGMTREFYKSGQLVPVTVLKVEKALLETPYDVLEDELLRNSFISLEDGDFILIGPYIDRSQLLLAQDYLNERYGKALGVIEKWQI